MRNREIGKYGDGEKGANMGQEPVWGYTLTHSGNSMYKFVSLISATKFGYSV